MIIEEGNHYLYRHIRLDTNQVFYVGIGKKNKNKKEYHRAFNKFNRNSYWENIVNKTGYNVDILLESNDYEFIKEKEIEFIALYGRKNLGLGALVNMTDGGDGSKGHIPTKETKIKISNANKGENSPFYGKKHSQERINKNRENNIGKKHSQESKDKMSASHKGKKLSPEHIQKIIESNTGKKLSPETKDKIKNSLKDRKLSTEHKNKISKSNKGINSKKCIFTNITTNEKFIFDSIIQGSNHFSLHQSLCVYVALGKRKQTGGFKIEYLNKNN